MQSTDQQPCTSPVHDGLTLSLNCCVRGEIPKGDDLLVKEDLIKLKRCIYAAQVSMSVHY